MLVWLNMWTELAIIFCQYNENMQSNGEVSKFVLNNFKDLHHPVFGKILDEGWFFGQRINGNYNKTKQVSGISQSKPDYWVMVVKMSSMCWISPFLLICCKKSLSCTSRWMFV